MASEFNVFALNSSPDHRCYDLEKLLNNGWKVQRADAMLPNPPLSVQNVIVYILERNKPD